MTAKDKVYEIVMLMVIIQVSFSVMNVAGVDEAMGVDMELNLVDEDEIRQQATEQRSTTPDTSIDYFSKIITAGLTVFGYILTLVTPLYQIFAIIPHPVARQIGATVQTVAWIVVIIGLAQMLRRG